MKTKLKTIFLIKLYLVSFLAILLSQGCTKTPINGNLDGEWEVIEVIPEPPAVENETRYFYNFSLHVCQLTVYGYPFRSGNLRYDGETMSLDFPYINTPEEELILKQYGIFSNPVTFDVYFENKSRLILSNDESTVVLKKF